MEEVSIQPKHYLTCLWPGMAELWWRGRFSALPAAVAFAAIVNALLVAKFIYSDWLSGGLVLLACWVVAAAWLVLTIRSIRELPLLLTPLQASEEPDRFPEAQIAFLRADYEQAEQLLNENLAIEPRDPPALLLLSAIYRHTGRLHASKLLLTEIRKLEVAEPWGLEFAAEQARLERDVAAREEEIDEADDDTSADSDNPETGGTAAEDVSADVDVESTPSQTDHQTPHAEPESSVGEQEDDEKQSGEEPSSDIDHTDVANQADAGAVNDASDEDGRNDQSDEVRLRDDYFSERAA
ncbi:hypothetical protein [Aporhodopirellula aestuarii]|uniref:Tetratricopeptide repeat protein n=1 Tax=Aporhodopirellula aestuarii TaxID=2950107 RepID=A0ABT0U1Z1_9BACT|nr:hypothetical protein [Aporhodopirellula aestuarii]MCM2370601.1 hypothetical protein [Aporhodopirellula aestuarii]